MPAIKFDSPLSVATLPSGDVVVKTQGDIALDVDEEPEEMCIKIFQDDQVLAEGHGSRAHSAAGHGPGIPVTSSSTPQVGTWHVDSTVQPGKVARPGKAIAAASLMTDGPGSAMSAYQWVQEVELA